jgi:uncharacterized lipoprotein YehR (DUF1307 family)
MKKIFVIAIAAMSLASCTENERARRFGGVEEVELKPNEVVLNVTWKENEMWICTKDTTTNTVYFREKSSWGVMEGTVILK